VKLEVEEDSKTQLRQLFDGLGALGCEELASYLENTRCPPELPRQGGSWPGAVNIQGDD
jgi:hypothetical protein